MPPSECPRCYRIYCDHSAADRGQTYAQMMGDPAGTQEPESAWEIQHKKMLKARAERHDKAVEILATEEVVRILLPEPVVFGIYHGEKHRLLPKERTKAVIITERDSEVHVSLEQFDADLLRVGGVAHIQAEDDAMFIWTGKRRKIRVYVDFLMIRMTEDKFRV